MKKFTAIAALALLASVGAYAQDSDAESDSGMARLGAGLYGELGFTKIKATNPAAFAGGSANPTMLRGVLGKELMPNLSAELMLGLGAGAGSADFKYMVGAVPMSARVESEVKSMLGFYIVPKIQLSDRAQAYARLGLTNMSTSDTSAAVMGGLPAGTSNNMTNGKKNSISWGLGASYRIGENVGMSLDYMVYHKKSQVKVDGVNIGVTYKF